LQPLTFTYLFLGALLLATAVRYWLASRQIRHVAMHRSEVPAQFRERIPLSAHQRAADYTVARVRLGIVDTAVVAALLLALTVFGGIGWIAEMLRDAAPDWTFARQVLLILIVGLVVSAADLPISLYRQFVLEQRFGFNRMTLRLYFVDLAKGAAVGAALGIPLIVAVLWLMQRAGELWWWWAWLVWIGFNLSVLVLYPSVIAPLFNRFQPLPDGPVRERVERLLGRCGFASRGLYVMDGSKRSAHGNAYFTGFGRSKRIVFFDTLLSRLNPDEIEAVLAHELGHFKRRHIVKRIAVSFAVSLAGLWLLGWLSRQPWFYQGLGVTPVDEHAAVALLLFFLAMPAFVFLLQPIVAWLSRRHEFEADAFAAQQTRASDLAAALVKLYEDNASTLTPDPVHSAFYDSHPPAAIRLGRLQALQSR
jgi:STE24 endopeptidase